MPLEADGEPLRAAVPVSGVTPDVATESLDSLFGFGDPTDGEGQPTASRSSASLPENS